MQRLMVLLCQLAMKNTYWLLLFITLTLSVSSCCKMACYGNYVYVSFENYRWYEADTVYFLGYQPNSNFTVLKDSMALTYPNLSTDTTKANVGRELSADKDWLIKIPQVNKAIRINNFETTTQRCNCGNGKYPVVKSFFVDGVQQTGTSFKLPR